MIRKQDILDRAGEWSLRPEVVEKDYVLGWLLAALGLVEDARPWIFKGGTCIKKCYVETFRFSEDLDFSLLPEAVYTEGAILETLRSIARVASELGGVQYPEGLIEIRSRRNKQGESTFEGRIPYSGPLAYPGFPRVRVDITQHEPVLDVVTKRGVFHPYPDELPRGAPVAAYSLDEVLAEKTRALYERARPRDLYDVVYLLENCPQAFDLDRVHDLFGRKCRIKNLSVPSKASLLSAVRADEELRSEWSNMLSHQIPALPDLDDLVARLPDLVRWLDERPAALPEARLVDVPIPADETPIASAGIRFWGTGRPLERIRLAAAIRVLVEFECGGSRHTVEPYVLAETLRGDVLLYGWDRASSRIERFDVAKIERFNVTRRPFSPRYRVALSSIAASQE